MSTTIKTGLIFILCVLDCVFSWWGVQTGYLVEANAILAPLMEKPLVFPFLIKNGYTLILLMILLKLEKRSPALVGKGLNLVAIVYAAVTALHIKYIYMNWVA